MVQTTNQLFILSPYLVAHPKIGSGLAHPSSGLSLLRFVGWAEATYDSWGFPFRHRATTSSHPFMDGFPLNHPGVSPCLETQKKWATKYFYVFFFPEKRCLIFRQSQVQWQSVPVPGQDVVLSVPISWTILGRLSHPWRTSHESTNRGF